MLTESVARRYAKALFDAALERKQIDTVKHELDKIMETLEKDKRLKEIWDSSRLFSQEKKRFIRKVFPELSGLMLNFLFLLIDNKREKILGAAKEEYGSCFLDFYNQIFVEVRSKFPVPENIQMDLKARLSERLGKRVELNITEDSSLIGGLIVQIGDTILDGSLSTKLNRLREELLNSPLPGVSA